MWDPSFIEEDFDEPRRVLSAKFWEAQPWTECASSTFELVLAAALSLSCPPLYGGRSWTVTDEHQRPDAALLWTLALRTGGRRAGST